VFKMVSLSGYRAIPFRDPLSPWERIERSPKLAAFVRDAALRSACGRRLSFTVIHGVTW
jgi:hypothetical protein